MRLRFRFEKRGPIRFASHRDVVRILQRGIAAAGLPVSYSRGFHPHMRMSFGPPLKTGWEGIDEYVDVHFEEAVDSPCERCNARLPDGLRLVACDDVVSGVPKLANDIAAAGYAVGLRADEVGIARHGGDGQLEGLAGDIADRLGGAGRESGAEPRVLAVSVEAAGGDVWISYTTTMHAGRVVSPREVSAMLGDPDGLATPPRVARRAQYVERDGDYLSPLDERVTKGKI